MNCLYARRILYIHSIIEGITYHNSSITIYSTHKMVVNTLTRHANLGSPAAIHVVERTYRHSHAHTTKKNTRAE